MPASGIVPILTRARARWDDDLEQRREPTGDDDFDFDAHRADVYALGMVLLEAIIGPTAAKLLNPVPLGRNRPKDSLKVVMRRLCGRSLAECPSSGP